MGFGAVVDRLLLSKIWIANGINALHLGHDAGYSLSCMRSVFFGAVGTDALGVAGKLGVAPPDAGAAFGGG